MRRSYRGAHIANVYVTAEYENIEVHYTLAFNEDMKLASFGDPIAGSPSRKHIGKINILKISVIISFEIGICAPDFVKREVLLNFSTRLNVAI